MGPGGCGLPDALVTQANGVRNAGKLGKVISGCCVSMAGIGDDAEMKQGSHEDQDPVHVGTSVT